MPQLLTQSDVRHARDLPFCYLCGGSITSRDDRHPDHVPPKAIFAQVDRNFPLKVATHRACNTEHSITDRVIGQLIAVIHKQYPADGDLAIKYQVYNVDSSQTPLLGIIDTNIIGQIGRWLRGFHAALYREFLPYETLSAIHPPFPHGERNDNGSTIKNILDQQYQFVEVIKKNRLTRSLDRIVCNNGKLAYDCVWNRVDDGRWICIFALQIYDWSKLADNYHFPERGCVGFYQPESGRPEIGTIGTELEFTIKNLEPLNAFET